MRPHSSLVRSCRATVMSISAALFVALIVIGCAATPQERYRVLSVFFDGVPNPDAPVRVSTASGRTVRRSFVHKPYADELCNSCHLNTADIFARAQVPEDVCLGCHANIPTQHPVMHGPVVNNACRMCHAAHLSAVPHLLKQPPPAVCTQCHIPAEVTPLHPAPFDVKQSCIDCHSGHGGTDHKMLRAFASPAATQPAPQSEVPR